MRRDLLCFLFLLLTLTACGEDEAEPPPCSDDCEAQGLQCFSATGSCVQCLFAADCGAGERCEETSCVPDTRTPCTADTDCAQASSPVCADSGYCEWGCRTSASCAEGEWCAPTHQCAPTDGDAAP